MRIVYIMMLVLNQVTAACYPSVIHTAKRMAIIQMINTDKPTVFTSIARVCKMVPEAIDSIMPYNQNDPWWPIRDIISSVLFMVGPQYGLVIALDKVFRVFHYMSESVFFIGAAITVFATVVTIQIEFLERYFR